MSAAGVQLPPFRSKAAIKRAMTVGTRWVMERPGGESGAQFLGTIVRASTTSRWIAWDDDPDARPTWLGVADSKGWLLEDGGFTETSSGTRLRFLAGPHRPERGDRFVDDIDEDGIVAGVIIVRPEDQIDPGESGDCWAGRSLGGA